MAREVEHTCFAIDSKNRDIVVALIAAIEKSAARIEIEAAWIIPARPFFTDETQFAVCTNGKDRDAIVHSIAGVHEATVRGDENLRAEITSGKAGRQRGDRLPRREPARSRIEIKTHDGRAFFLDRIQPTPVWMKCKVPRTIAG